MYTGREFGCAVTNDTAWCFTIVLSSVREVELAKEGASPAAARATIVVSSFALRRDALAALLEMSDFRVVARSRNLRAGLAEIEAGVRPALLLMDLHTWTRTPDRTN